MFQYYNITFKENRDHFHNQFSNSGTVQIHQNQFGFDVTGLSNFNAPFQSKQRDHSPNNRLTILSSRKMDAMFQPFNENDYHAIIQSMLSFMKVPCEQPLTVFTKIN